MSHEIVEHDSPIIAVGGVVYRWTEAGLELLLIKKQGGFWTLPKGRVKPGEAEHDAVLREVKEETGIKGKVGANVQQVIYTTYKAGRPRLKSVTYYLMRASRGRLRPQAKERIERVRWFPIDAALRRIRRERIRGVVHVAQAMLESSEDRPSSDRERGREGEGERGRGETR
jgi:8-oxo-dGTP diphosphatase